MILPTFHLIEGFSATSGHESFHPTLMLLPFPGISFAIFALLIRKLIYFVTSFLHDSYYGVYSAVSPPCLIPLHIENVLAVWIYRFDWFLLEAPARLLHSRRN